MKWGYLEEEQSFYYETPWAELGPRRYDWGSADEMPNEIAVSHLWKYEHRGWPATCQGGGGENRVGGCGRSPYLRVLVSVRYGDSKSL